MKGLLLWCDSPYPKVGDLVMISCEMGKAYPAGNFTGRITEIEPELVGRKHYCRGVTAVIEDVTAGNMNGLEPMCSNRAAEQYKVRHGERFMEQVKYEMACLNSTNNELKRRLREQEAHFTKLLVAVIGEKRLEEVEAGLAVSTKKQTNEYGF